MCRAYYENQIAQFCKQTLDEILGEISRNNKFSLEQKQKNAWIKEISLLQDVFANFKDGGIAFEYTIPRIGSRVDTIFICNGIIYLIEFKVGETAYQKHAIDQVLDYALDLKYFHKESQNKKIVPILVCTDAESFENTILKYEDGIYNPLKVNEKTLGPMLQKLTNELRDDSICFENWVASPYMPTPTIIEAAQAMYRGHDVKAISRSDSGAYNLDLTTNAINEIIDFSKRNRKKSICFITGVPGAGKTLAGLNIATSRHNYAENEHAVFLSGNGPLVLVLQEALARDEYIRSDHTIKKSFAKKKASAFIQNIHHFRDAAIKVDEAPIEKVVIFDEAQRAWTREQTSKFMSERGHSDWDKSEPEFLISVMDRHEDWAVIVCLIGGGQEINTGEAGLPAWFAALKSRFSNWDVYISKKISEYEYTRDETIDTLVKGLEVKTFEQLHLAVSLRSFRSERVSEFVKMLLDIEKNSARELYKELSNSYPIFLTRDLRRAKQWVREKSRGSERYGMIASSGAKRLRSFGIWVQSKIKVENWFLDGKEDVRSSYFLEDTATEFDVQGLEIDWAIVAWDADYRMVGGQFLPYNFKGTRWNTIKKEDERLYLKNTYRVLLTRARQGVIIFIPNGTNEDITRQECFYDETYDYLKSLGIEEI